MSNGDLQPNRSRLLDAINAEYPEPAADPYQDSTLVQAILNSPPPDRPEDLYPSPNQLSTIYRLRKQGYDDAQIIGALKAEAEDARQKEEQSRQKQIVPRDRTFFQRLGERFARNQRSSKLDQLTFLAYTGFPGAPSIEEVEELAAEYKARAEQDPVEARNFLESVMLASAGFAGSMAQGATEGGIQGASAGMIGAAALGQMGPQFATPEEFLTIPISGGVGFMAGSSMFFAQQGAGQVMRNLIDRGVDSNMAAIFGTIAGLPYALLERLQVTKLIPKSLQKKGNQVVVDSFAKGLSELSKKYGQDYATQIVQEDLQLVTTTVAEELSVFLQNQVADDNISQRTMDEFMTELKATTVETMKGVIPLMGAGGTVDVAALRKATKAQDVVSGLIDAKKEIEQDDAGQAELFAKEELKALTEEINADDANDFQIDYDMDDNGEIEFRADDQRIAYDIDLNKFEETGETKDGVKTYKGWVRGTNSLEGGVTLTNSADSSTLLEETVEYRLKSIGQDKSAESQQLIAKIHIWATALRKKAAESGLNVRFSDTAEGNIELFSDAMVYHYGGYSGLAEGLAELTYIPMDLAEQFISKFGEMSDGTNLFTRLAGSDVRGATQQEFATGVAGEMAALEMEEGIDEARAPPGTTMQLSPTDPAMQAWFGDSKIVDEEGKPKVMYHGTNRGFSEFRPGSYFGSVAAASNFTGNVLGEYGRPQMYPVYLRLENPLDMNEVFSDATEMIFPSEFLIKLEEAVGKDMGQLEDEIFNELLFSGLHKSEMEYDQEPSGTEEPGYRFTDIMQKPDSAMRKYVEGAGYDGLIVPESFNVDAEKTSLQDTYMVFNPEQVKSVFNKGTFNPQDPNISYQLASQKPKRYGTTGQYVAYPRGTKSPQQLGVLRKFFKGLAKEGENRRFWYENSAQALLDMTDGNKGEALKLLQMIAITSPQRRVKENFKETIKALYQHLQGVPLKAGAFPNVMEKKLQAVIDGEEWGGLKTDRFYKNLAELIQKKDDKGVTVDVWMMRSFGYDSDNPTDAQYRVVELETQKIADELGWEPHQTQAAIWSSGKARWEKIWESVKKTATEKGDYKPGKGGGWKSEAARRKHRKAAYNAMRSVDVTPEEVATAGFDYADAIKATSGRMSLETTPHSSIDVLPGIHDAPIEQRVEYDGAIRQVLVDEDGNDRIFAAIRKDKVLGIPIINTFTAPGFYEGKQNPSQHLEIPFSYVEGPIKKKQYDKVLAKPVKDTIELYGSIYGLAIQQESVGYSKEYPSQTKIQANAVAIEYDGLNEEHMSDLYDLIREETGVDTGVLPTAYGGVIINFMDDKGNPYSSVSNNDFYAGVERVIENYFKDDEGEVNLKRATALGGLVENNWEIDKNGESYQTRISKTGRSDIYVQLARDIRSEVNQVNQEFSDKYGWGNPTGPTFQLSPVDPSTDPHPFDTLRDLSSEKTLELSDESTWQYVYRKVGNLLDPLSRYQQDIKDQFNTDIVTENDAMTAAQLFIGRADKRIKNLFRDIYDVKNPDSFVMRLKNAGITVDDFGKYLHAKHAEERNLKIAGRYPDDNNKQDGGSGLDTAQAEKILKELKEKYKGKGLHLFANEFRREVINKSLDIRLESGLLSQEDYDRLKGGYKNYVPLFRVFDTEESITDPKSGTSGFSVLGREFFKAKGSTREVINPFMGAITQAEMAILRAEKNQVTKKLLDLVEGFPSESITVKGVQHIPDYNELGEIEYMTPVLPPKFDAAGNSIETMDVKVDGVTRRITFSGENGIRIARALKGIGTQTGFALGYKINTFLRMVNTVYNPRFIISNFMRDFQTAGIHITSEQGNAIAMSALNPRNIAKAMKGVYKNISKGDIDSEWAKLYEEMQLEGGRTGYFDFDDMTQKLEKLEKKLNNVEKTGSGIKAAGTAIADAVNHANESVESCIRLTLYKAMVDQGHSKSEAALAAKSVTVNFNQKGEIGQLMNSIYLFFNAAVQGNLRIIASLAKHKRTRQFATGLVGLGFMESLYNHYTDDDDDPAYEKLNQFDKDNNYIIQIPGKGFVKIRVPYGYNVFKTMGNIAGDYAHAIEQRKHIENDMVLARFLGALNQAYNPLGGGDFMQSISPTLFDPFLQIYGNKTWSLAPIKPENVYPPHKAEIELAWKNTPGVYKDMSYWMYQLDGGQIRFNDDGSIREAYKGPGSWSGDVSPEYLEFFVDFVGGGAARTMMQTVESGLDLTQGKVEPANNPLISLFYKPYDEKAEMSMLAYYEKRMGNTLFAEHQRAKYFQYLTTAKKKEIITGKQFAKRKKAFIRNQNRITNLERTK